MCIVVLGCVAGAMTPLALHRAKVDPATSSTPFISTMVDVLGIIIYLTLAQLLLGAALSAEPAALIPGTWPTGRAPAVRLSIAPSPL